MDRLATLVRSALTASVIALLAPSSANAAGDCSSACMDRMASCSKACEGGEACQARCAREHYACVGQCERAASAEARRPSTNPAAAERRLEKLVRNSTCPDGHGGYRPCNDDDLRKIKGLYEKQCPAGPKSCPTKRELVQEMAARTKGVMCVNEKGAMVVCPGKLTDKMDAVLKKAGVCVAEDGSFRPCPNN